MPCVDNDDNNDSGYVQLVNNKGQGPVQNLSQYMKQPVLVQETNQLLTIFVMRVSINNVSQE